MYSGRLLWKRYIKEKDIVRERCHKPVFHKINLMFSCLQKQMKGLFDLKLNKKFESILKTARSFFVSKA
jgi:collagenase-like PrtC family protease